MLIGPIARLTRTAVLEVLGADFVRTARAKGLRETAVIVHHALRNAMIPVVTLIGLQAAFLLGGAVVTETMFSWPGVGRLAVGAIVSSDFPTAQGAIMILAIAFLSINLLVDVLYVYLDPRVSAKMSVDALDSRLCQRIRKPASFARAGVLRRLARDRVAAVAALALTAIVLAALLAPWIAPYDPYFTDLTKVMQPPGAEHWFGTDNTGRDILSRVIYGTRNTLMLGLVGVIVGGLIGGVLGILAAYYRRLDGWIMRLVDVMLAFPAILIGLAVAAIFGAGLAAVVIALVVATVPDVARVARGAAIGVMGQEFMEAGRAVGVIGRRADLALPDAELHFDDLRVPHPALRPDHPDRLGARLPRHGRAAADRRARHDGGAGPRLPVHGAAHRDRSRAARSS